jgi:hypothetical protein
MLHSKAVGWGVERAFVVKASFFALAIVVGIHALTEGMIGTGSLTSYGAAGVALMYFLFVSFSVPLPTIRVVRSLPISATWLSANILLVAYIPSAIFLLVLVGLHIAGIGKSLPQAAGLMLLAAPAVQSAAMMRLGRQNGSALAFVPAAIATTVLFVPVQEGSPPRLFASAVVIAILGSFWLRQTLLAGRERSFRGEAGFNLQ